MHAKVITVMYVGAAGKREISSFKPRKQSVPYNLILCWLYHSLLFCVQLKSLP